MCFLDPLNLPNWRKMAAILILCLFGSMAAAAELILGAMLPIFSFEYAGLDPKLLVHIHLPEGTNGLAALALFPGPPIWEIYLLASAPILMIGIANFFLVPLSIALGRRSILLTTGIIALAGCVGSGFSVNLGTHLACRVIQALGAGTVESLIPFIIQDMVFYHQRNAAISVVFATQVRHEENAPEECQSLPLPMPFLLAVLTILSGSCHCYTRCRLSVYYWSYKLEAALLCHCWCRTCVLGCHVLPSS